VVSLVAPLLTRRRPAHDPHPDLPDDVDLPAAATEHAAAAAKECR
jgi:zinc transport system permease protein